MIETYFHPTPLAYTGVELTPHFILSKFKKEDSTLAAFIGPCRVKTDHLVDWEDRLNSDFIEAKNMLHFLGEFFGITLKEGVWIQRLIVGEILVRLLARGILARRDGDDLFISGASNAGQKLGKADQKLSVSIVTASPVSVLLHLGINIDATGAPVSAVGLSELNVDAKELAEEILAWFKIEYQSVWRACVKVRAVI